MFFSIAGDNTDGQWKGAVMTYMDDASIADVELAHTLWLWLRFYLIFAANENEFRATGCLDSGLM